MTPRSEGRRTDFTLTDAGKAYVADHAEELENAWNNDAEGSGPAFHQSVGKLMGVIHQFRTRRHRRAAHCCMEKLDETRRALYQILADPEPIYHLTPASCIAFRGPCPW